MVRSKRNSTEAINIKPGTAEGQSELGAFNETNELH